jgi:hypothetical protein
MFVQGHALAGTSVRIVEDACNVAVPKALPKYAAMPDRNMN